MVPPVHRQMAVLAVHGQYFDQVGVGLRFGALLDISVGDRPCNRQHIKRKVNTPPDIPAAGKHIKKKRNYDEVSGYRMTGTSETKNEPRRESNFSLTDLPAPPLHPHRRLTR